MQSKSSLTPTTRRLIVVAHNIRSAHNVGSIFRSCEGFGVERLFLTGYTPHPGYNGDPRLPHIAAKLEKQIHKTALGAENILPFTYHEDINAVIRQLRTEGFLIIGLEQTPQATLLPHFTPPEKCALVLGEEVAGIPPKVRRLCDGFIEIPMSGRKESFNVSVATGIALYAVSIHGA